MVGTGESRGSGECGAYECCILHLEGEFHKIPVHVPRPCPLGCLCVLLFNFISVSRFKGPKLEQRGRALNHPAGGGAADGVGRDAPAPLRRWQRQSACNGHDGQNHRNEGQLPGLHAHVEEEQRKGDGLWRQADLAESACETKSVEETKTNATTQGARSVRPGLP